MASFSERSSSSRLKDHGSTVLDIVIGLEDRLAKSVCRRVLILMRLIAASHGIAIFDETTLRL